MSECDVPELARSTGVTRRGLFAGGAGFAVAGLLGGCRCSSPTTLRTFALNGRCALNLQWSGLAEPVRFVVIGDTHFAFTDARDAQYAGHCKRMAQWPGKEDAIAKALKRAKDDKADLVVLVGDNISFPTQANVDHLKRELEKSEVPWVYTAGNHDWHFEGDVGSDIEQRGRWLEKRLKWLYRGENPLCYSKVVKGVRFVMVDNSVYHVLPEQLEFWRQEAAKGDPLVLCMHIPLWTEGWGERLCGSPAWGAAVDPYWEIERRERWAERQMPSTFEFRESVMSTPNLIGIFTGHVHNLMVAQERGQLMFSVPGNADGSSMEVTVGVGYECK